MDPMWMLRLGGWRLNCLIYLAHDPVMSAPWLTSLGRAISSEMVDVGDVLHLGVGRYGDHCGGGRAANCGATKRSLQGFLFPDPVVASAVKCIPWTTT